MTNTFMKMWKRPIQIGIATTIGLLAALLGDGGWDLLSAVTLGVPVAVAAWLGLVRRSR